MGESEIEFTQGVSRIENSYCKVGDDENGVFCMTFNVDGGPIVKKDLTEFKREKKNGVIMEEFVNLLQTNLPAEKIYEIINSRTVENTPSAAPPPLMRFLKGYEYVNEASVKATVCFPQIRTTKSIVFDYPTNYELPPLTPELICEANELLAGYELVFSYGDNFKQEVSDYMFFNFIFQKCKSNQVNWEGHGGSKIRHLYIDPMYVEHN